MKRIPLAFAVVAACLFGAGTSLHAQTPLLEFNFNNASSSTVTSSGSVVATGTVTGTYAAGVTGAAGDYSFDNSASTGMGNVGTGGGVLLSTSAGGYKSLTLQGWFNSSTVLGNAARLIDGYNTASGSGFQLRADVSTPGALVLTMDGLSTTASLASYNSTNTWVFFALTYDITTKIARFYKGDATTAVAQVGTDQTLDYGAGITATRTGGSNITIGDLAGSNTRPYDGLLDDVRVFGSATDASGVLSLSQLESLRTADLVPEPSSVALMALGGMMFLFGKLRRRSLLS